MTKLGKYEIIAEIGRGGFAVVYEARDTELDRIIALKVIHSAFTREASFVHRFRQEARIAAGLRHPGIVTVYDFGDTDGTLYLAMALIGRGRTLRDMLTDEGPLSLERALPILAQLADALDYLHQRSSPLTHRDVKPANVLLEQEGDALRVVLTDFGLVRSMRASSKITESGSILGTPAYMAPEQADSRQWGAVTPLTDVYGLGVVAYEMLTGHVPFEGKMATVLHAHAYEPPPSPLDLGTDLAKVLTRALAKPPAERYPDAGALVAALRQVAETRARQEGQQAELAHLLAQARDSREAGDWLTVQDLCVRVLQVDRTHPDALEMMAEAMAGLQRESAEETLHRQLVRRYEEGEQALVAGQWQAALAAFEQVAADNPGFRDIQEKLIQTRDRYQRAQWYDAAISHNEAERWAEACRTWINVLRGQFDYRDGDAVERLLDATERLLEQYDEQSRQAHEMLLLFDALTAAVEGKDWERAIEIGERLLQLAPDLDYPQTWLARARDAQKAKLERPTPPPLDPRHLGTGDLPPLAVLADRYVILEKVAQGGTGAIYRARDQRRQDKVVAVKEMSGATIPPAERELAIESFQRVAAVLDQLEHPNMAQVTHHFQAWGRHYIVTEFIHGQTLAQMLKDRREPFSEEQMLAWAVQLCDVLSYLHSQEPKIIYRGLKPDNVMVERDTDTVKLVSFSIARFFKPGHDKDTLALGALGYAAPEQYGTAQTDERTDIYALGVTLHQLLTLHDPTTKMFVFPPVHQLNPLVSRHVAQAIAKAINRDPADRFQTALEMKKALLRH